MPIELSSVMKRAACAEMNAAFKSFKDHPKMGVVSLPRIRNILKAHPYLWELGLIDFSSEELEMAEKSLPMVYFAIATLYLYRADIVAVQGPQTPEEFTERNKDVVKLIQDEALHLFHYKLSSEQMGRAIIAFLAPGKSVTKTTPATMP